MEEMQVIASGQAIDGRYGGYYTLQRACVQESLFQYPGTDVTMRVTYHSRRHCFGSFRVDSF